MSKIKSNLPDYVLKYFWGDDLKELSWDKHRDYITETILEKGDEDSVRWLFSKLDKEAIKKSLSDFKLSPKSRNFWSVYLS